MAGPFVAPLFFVCRSGMRILDWADQAVAATAQQNGWAPKIPFI